MNRLAFIANVVVIVLMVASYETGSTDISFQGNGVHNIPKPLLLISLLVNHQCTIPKGLTCDINLLHIQHIFTSKNVQAMTDNPK